MHPEESPSPNALVGLDEPRRSRELFLTVFRKAPIATCLVDTQGRVIDCNEVMVELLGYSLDELRAMHVRDFTLPEDRPATDTYIRRWVSGEVDLLRIRKRYLRKDGGVVWAFLTMTVARDAQGVVRFGIAMLVDETEQHRMEEALQASEERFRLVFDRAPIALLLVDRHGRAIEGNPAFRALLEVGERLPKQSYADVNHPEDRAREDVLFHELLTGKRRSYQLEKRIFTRHGQLVWVDAHVTLAKGPEHPDQFAIVSLVDITARRQAETMKDEFLSVVSHELRTPLTILLGANSLLADQLLGPLNPSQLDAVRQVETQARALQGQLDNLLDVSRMIAGRFELYPEPITLPPLVAATLRQNQAEAERRRQQLRAELPEDLPDVLADPIRLQQVLNHLVANAMKFTPDGGLIRVRARREGDQVRVEVLDTGVGIALEDVPKLFRPFEQLDMSSTRRAGGMGLGLTIVRALVEAQRGTVGIDSQPGSGSTFWFTVPALSFPERPAA